MVTGVTVLVVMLQRADGTWGRETGPERTLHADYFGRKSDEEFREYTGKKPYNIASIDGLPALGETLPATG